MSCPSAEREIPWGSYKLTSQFNETLYVAVGKKKLSISPGKSMMLNAIDFDGSVRVTNDYLSKAQQQLQRSGSTKF